MKKIFFSTIVAILFSATITAQQFKLSSEIRPRYENKHGYQTLLPTGADGSNFISQRSRLNFDFSQNYIVLKMSLQNIRVWGDVSTLSASDNANSLHEAWASVLFSDTFSLKLGRQEIIYDDSRIFGNVGWAQQARSHDAAIAKFNFTNGGALDLGFALNSDSQVGTDILYSNVAGYKTFQYAWYHKNFSQFGMSLLALNTGVEFIKNAKQEIDYSQTFGGRITYKKDRIDLDAASYLQTGSIRDIAMSASYFAANASYKLTTNYTAALGFEYLSGKDMDDTSVKIKSFNPLFGTNHKFNGWMDYFYVGNHINSVGLVDIHAILAYKKNKFSAKVVPHIFSSAANIYSGATKMSNNLGTEIDVTLGYDVANNITISGGYSKMFATKSLEVLKGGDKNENNSWAWLMVTFNPELFNFTK